METNEINATPTKSDFDEYRYGAWVAATSIDDTGYFTFYNCPILATKEHPGAVICKVSFKKLGRFKIEEKLVEVK